MMNPQKWVFCSLLIQILFFDFCTSIHTIAPNQSLKDGEILVSSGERFALGFFSPKNSKSRYLGIWYKKLTERAVVWVANRDNPINGTSGVLTINEDGNLIIYDDDDDDQMVPLWQTNVSTAENTTNYSARLLDSGNLALFGGNNIGRSGGGGGVKILLWQSFDYPTNTLLPGMKLGLDRRTGLERFLTSWESADNPATGEYSCRVDHTGLPQVAVLLNKGSVPLWRAGPWVGSKSLTKELALDFIFNTTYLDNEDEVSVYYEPINASTKVLIIVLNEFGSLKIGKWFEDAGRWGFYAVPKDQCDKYAWCGVNQLCDPSTELGFECTCLPGYTTESGWKRYPRYELAAGCVKKHESISMCGNGEGFVKVENAWVPDASSSKALGWRELSLDECREECLRNCSCTAFASSRGADCITWYGNMTDTKIYNGGVDLYVRVDAIELAQHSKRPGSLHGKKLTIVVTTGVSVPLLIVSLVFWLVRNKAKRDAWFYIRANTEENLELSIFNIVTISEATNKFSNSNKIGEGGFGPVYKGQLSKGKDIAVKRLSTNSNQGLNEFENEVLLITKLQHRNLVRLLGCCVHGEERMLVYEYMPNGSLDSFIFDVENTSTLLSWKKRLDIIMGIARGVLYLHEDSRLRVIHRDLKVSNILLDYEMKPKISDFGLAKTFEADQASAKTKRVVGTYGYMSPEYAFNGLYSIKSDVFSFGVMVLEIISGKRNRMYHHSDHDLSLLEHAWKLWIERRAFELLDPTLKEGPISISEALKCMQIGLLYVQKCSSERPTMSCVLSMLVTETAILPQPKQPGFYTGRSSTETHYRPSINDVTITDMEAR